MKTVAIVLLVGFCALAAVHGQEPQYRQLSPKARAGVDYPIKIHVTSTRIRQRCKESLGRTYCEDLLYAEVSTNSGKLELARYPISDLDKPGVLVPGDYRARLTKDQHNSDSTVIYQEYEVVLPDKTIWHCTLTRISE